jgi:hypothetical protein
MMPTDLAKSLGNTFFKASGEDSWILLKFFVTCRALSKMWSDIQFVAES